MWWWLEVDSTEIFSVPKLAHKRDLLSDMSLKHDLLSDMSQKRNLLSDCQK